jgi:AcrR family transcriptional regulator
MPPAPRPANLHDDFEARGLAILDAALREFCDKGYSAVSIGSIAASVGISDGLIYKHFESKEHLLYEAIAWAYAEVAANIVSEVAKADSPRDRLRRFVELHLESWRDTPAFNLLYFHETRRPPHKYSAIVSQQSRKFVRCLEGILRDGVASGDFDPGLNVRFIRDFVIGGIDHAVWWSAARGRRIDVQALTDQAMRYVLPAILAADHRIATDD